MVLELLRVLSYDLRQIRPFHVLCYGLEASIKGALSQVTLVTVVVLWFWSLGQQVAVFYTARPWGLVLLTRC
jgi:hypothetical protein